MKQKIGMITTGLITTLALIFFAMQGCGGPGSGIKPHAKTSFDEVTSHLDKGGNFYLYANTKRVVKAVDDFIEMIRGLIETQAKQGAMGKMKEVAEGLKYFDFFAKLYKNSGIAEIEGIGVSSVSIEENLNHSKIMIYHPKGKGSGLIWQLAAGKPHKLKLLAMLPQDTVLAGSGDFKINTLWQWLKKEVDGSGLEQLKEGLNMVEPMMKKQGLDFNKLIGSFSGAMGYLVTLDSKDIKKIPMGKMALELPDPGFALTMAVKDDYIFQMLKSKLPMARFLEKENDKRLQFPSKPMPITLQPVVVQTEGLLIIASSNKIVDQMLAANKSGNGLTKTEEFKRLSQHMPEEGNGFRFTGKRFLGTFINTWKTIAVPMGRGNQEAQKVLEMMEKVFPKDNAVYGVSQHLDNGTLSTMNHTIGFESLMLMPAIAVTGIVAAIAIPNAITAMGKGKQKATMGDMKSIGTAIESYITDNEEAPQGRNLQEIADKLIPFHTKFLPRKDAWGNEFLYMHGIGDKKDTYFIASPGKDGIFDGFDQQGFYRLRSVKGFANDIIFSNGNFVYGPGAGRY